MSSRRKEKNRMAEDSGLAAGELGAGPVAKNMYLGRIEWLQWRKQQKNNNLYVSPWVKFVRT